MGECSIRVHSLTGCKWKATHASGSLTVGIRDLKRKDRCSHATGHRERQVAFKRLRSSKLPRIKDGFGFRPSLLISSLEPKGVTLNFW